MQRVFVGASVWRTGVKCKAAILNTLTQVFSDCLTKEGDIPSGLNIDDVMDRCLRKYNGDNGAEGDTFAAEATGDSGTNADDDSDNEDDDLELALGNTSTSASRPSVTMKVEKKSQSLQN